MDNKWNMTGAWVIVGILAVLVTVLGINSSVKGAIDPVSSQLQEIASLQKDIASNMGKTAPADMQGVLRRLEALERAVQELKAGTGNVVAKGVDNAAALQAARQEAARVQVVHEIPLDGSAILGKADAPVTITVFNDFQCPYCSRFYPAAADAVKAYPGKVRLVLKHYPLGFHPNAAPAAKAAMAAGVQGKFYEMSDLLFANNKDLTEATFVKLAGDLKLNVAKFTKDLKERDAEWQKQIQADMDLAEKVGVRGTPSYYLNGKVSNARTAEQWKAEIDALLGGAGK